MIEIDIELRIVIAARSQPDAEGQPVQPAPAGERQSEAMSAEDAAIVRRIRTRCPDKRFDGGTDAELLDLFRRNKRVLERSDEDVIAAMRTRGRGRAGPTYRPATDRPGPAWATLTGGGRPF